MTWSIISQKSFLWTTSWTFWSATADIVNFFCPGSYTVDGPCLLKSNLWWPTGLAFLKPSSFLKAVVTKISGLFEAGLAFLQKQKFTLLSDPKETSSKKFIDTPFSIPKKTRPFSRPSSWSCTSSSELLGNWKGNRPRIGLDSNWNGACITQCRNGYITQCRNGYIT